MTQTLVDGQEEFLGIINGEGIRGVCGLQKTEGKDGEEGVFLSAGEF